MPGWSSISREDAKLMVGPGWASLIDKLYDHLPETIYVMQVKEKWGGLRFYVGSATMEDHEFIDKVEEESYSICEICGKPGKPRDLPWVLTLCEEHYAEYEAEWEKRRREFAEYQNKRDTTP